MTTQTVLTVVGTVVGAYFGYPQLGALIGAAVGYALTPDPPAQRGPRLDDRRVQVSTYGVSIPYEFGGTRLAGNVFWAKDLEEVETDTETGKGGPTQTQITYTYYGTFAVLLCKGPTRGISRIWADAVLIFDGQQANPAGFPIDTVFYAGTEDQLPDPTIEADVGVGSTPAYRGYSYIVFNRLPLELFGNRLPSISVELLGDGEFDPEETVLPGNVPVSRSFEASTQLADGSVACLIVDAGVEPDWHVKVYDTTTGEVLREADFDGDEHSGYAGGKGIICYVPPLDEIWVTGPGLIYRLQSPTLAFAGQIIGMIDAPDMAYDTWRRKVYWRNGSAQAGGENVLLSSSFAGVDVLNAERAGYFNLDGTIIFEAMDAIVGFEPGGFLQFCYDLNRRRYVGAATGESSLVVITDTNPPVITREADGFPHEIVNAVHYDSATDTVIVMSQILGRVVVTILDAGTFEVLDTEGDVSGGVSNKGTSEVYGYAPGELFVVGGTEVWRMPFFGTTVGDAVARLCYESGLSDYDVSELTQRLRGFLVSNVGPARSAVEQLATCFLFEGAEQDDVLYFRRRGGAIVETILADDCGADVDQPAEYPISRTRSQEADLPATVYVSAPDPFTDYQPGTQYAPRQAGRAGDDEQLQVAVVLNVDENRQLAYALLFDRWASRGRRSWSTSRRFARLAPTDPVLLDGERVRIISRGDEGALIRWEGITDDPEVISQTISGVQGKFPRQVIVVGVPTTMVIMDMALLSDAEDDAGAYVAVYGIPPHWRGGIIYYSTDGGLGWVRLLTMPAPGSSVGAVSDALGDWSGGVIFDEENVLNVSLVQGELSSTTRAGVLAGGNAIAVNGADGWEVVQYRDATLELDGTYTLRGLLRGRRGTQYAMGGHADGDEAVPLTFANIRDLPLTNTQIGVELPYKPVSVGDTLAATPTQEITINAERLKPWSPVDFRVARDVDTGDATLTWKRRTRLACRFVGSGGINVPLGEETEEYEVEIIVGGVVARTFTGLTTAETPYTAEEQAEDGQIPGDPICVRIYQISATVGRGHPLEVCNGGTPGPIYVPEVPIHESTNWSLRLIHNNGTTSSSGPVIGNWDIGGAAIVSGDPEESYYYFEDGSLQSALYGDQGTPNGDASSTGSASFTDPAFAFTHLGCWVTDPDVPDPNPEYQGTLTFDAFEGDSPRVSADPSYSITTPGSVSGPPVASDIGPRNFDILSDGELLHVVRDQPVWDGSVTRVFTIKHTGLNFYRLRITAKAPAIVGTRPHVDAFEMYSAVGGSDVCSGGFGDSNGAQGTSLGNEAFDGGSGWIGNAAPGPWWLRYEFPADTTIVQYGIRVDDATAAPMDWSFEVSVNGATWTVVDRQVGVVFSAGVLQKFTLRREVIFGSPP